MWAWKAKKLKLIDRFHLPQKIKKINEKIAGKENEKIKIRKRRDSITSHFIELFYFHKSVRCWTRNWKNGKKKKTNVALIWRIKIWYLILPWVGVNQMHNGVRGMWRHHVRWHHRWGRNERMTSSWIHSRSDERTQETSRVKKKHKIGQDSNFSTANAPYEN